MSIDFKKFYKRLNQSMGNKAVGPLGKEREEAKLVYNQFWGETPPKESEIPPNEIHMIFDSATINNPDKEIIIKKALLYSKCSYFVTPHTLKREEHPLMEDAYGNIPSRYKVDDGFIKLIIENQEIITSGYVKFIPKKALFSTTDRFSGKIEDYINADHSNLLHVKLKHQYLADQLTERNGIRIFLPHLKGIKTSEMIKIRTEYRQQFEDFQFSLSKLLKGRFSDGDRKLYELMQEVDTNVRQIRDRVDNLRRKSWFDTMKVTIGLFPLVLTYISSPQLADGLIKISELLGTSSILGFIGNAFNKKEEMRSIKRDAFLVPWLLANENKE